MRIPTLTLLVALLLGAAVRADEPVNAEFFEKKVRPILTGHCVSCHGPQKQKGGLRLDSKAGFTAGAQNGALVKSGDPDKSLLIRVIRYDGDIKMPQKGKLPDADIATLTTWVKGGAPWPDDIGGAVGPGSRFDLHARAKAHWSFQPVERPAVPDIRSSKSPIRNEIDRFLLAKLHPLGLEFAPPAGKRVYCAGSISISSACRRRPRRSRPS